MAGRFTRVEQGEDVGVREARRQVDFLKEPLGPEHGRQIRTQDLQRDRPVMLEIPTDVASEEIDDTFDYTPPRRVRSAGGPDEIAAAAQALLAAQHPILHVGQGALYAQATEELIVLAELLQVPVMTTMAGKSAFPENHPLSLGAGGRTVSGMVKHFLTNADLVCGLGCSFSIEFSTLIPRGKVLIQNTIDESDINKHYTIDHAIIGDCRLVVRQLIDEVTKQLGQHGRRERSNLAQEIRAVKQSWLAEWCPSSPPTKSQSIPIG